MENRAARVQPVVAIQSSTFAKTEVVRGEMTREVTRLFTAAVIAEPAFPLGRTLPPFLPQPFNNHGHMLQTDYNWMLCYLWSKVDAIQEAAKKVRTNRTVVRIVCLVIFLAIGLTLIANSNDGSVLGQLAGLVFLSFVIYRAIVLKVCAALPKKIGELRADAIKTLLENKDDALVAGKLQQFASDSKVGGGNLQTCIPILIIQDTSHPFPGFGRLQADITYVCPPKESSTNSLESLRELVSANIKRFVANSGIHHVTFGQVIAVHGESIHMDDPLLVHEENGERVPRLTATEDELKSVDSGRLNSSSRSYFAAEVLFPQYMTVATFFIRPFWAGNAIGYQLAVTTLGPSIHSREEILKILMKHRMEESENDGSKEENEKHPTIDREGKLWLLRYVRARIYGGPRFQPKFVNIDDLLKLKKYRDVDVQTEYDNLVGELESESIMWPGYYIAVRNWREENSYTTTTDYFGRPEMVASVKALYSQISKAILDTLDSVGFDISEYRDKEGNYSIHADKIDSLVMGERIFIEKNADTPESESGKVSAT
jgi:hypothetical protein